MGAENPAAGMGANSLLKFMLLHSEAGDAGDRTDILSLCIKSSDICHAAKPWQLHELWSKRILTEFFNQGDAERKAGMPISSLCDRETEQVFKGQIGFIDFLAMPQAKAWCQCLNSEKVYADVLGTMEANRARWAKLKEEGADETPFKDRSELRQALFEMPEK